MQELTYPERKRVHNLKYYTWVEQQGRDMHDLNRQWYERSYWQDIYDSAERIDELIGDFNRRIAGYR
jgi:cysteine synthase A